MEEQNKSAIKNKVMKIITILALLICTQYTFVLIDNEDKNISKKNLFYSVVSANTNANGSNIDQNEGEYIRLTDLEWRKESRAGYGSLAKNQDCNGSKLSVKMEGAYYTFDYGIWAHATSNVYYDISEYSEKYHYLTMYVGINKTSSAGNGVKFWTYTRDDENFVASGTNTWELRNETLCLPEQNAQFVKIDIRGAKYLRLQPYDNGSNGNDHSVYIDPMLITDNYQEETNPYGNITKYDNKIKEYKNKDLSDPEYEKLVLQRKLVSSVGGYALKRFIDEDPANQETIDWLMNDVENLRYYLIGGAPTGGYYNSLKVLTRLLKAYKSDFDIQEPISDLAIKTLEKRHLNYPTTKGNLYKRMAITLSLTHSSTIALWMQPSVAVNQSDAVNRYKIYKDLYNNGKFQATDKVDMTAWFETYTIEEMRYVMHTLIDDEEILWLNEYTQTRIDAQPNSVGSLLTPHPYMAYVYPAYGSPLFYSAENRDYFNTLFQTKIKDPNDPTKVITKGLFDYEITRAEAKSDGKFKLTKGREELGEGTIKVYKLWMNMRNKFGTGAVCGGISKTGHCIRGVNAIPSAVIGQPGHAALLYYTRNTNGQGYWGIDNDVSGWTLSEKGERLPLGWGNDRSYRGTYNVPYIALAQEAMNDMPNLTKAEELLMTVDVYKDDKAKQEQIYREAIRVQSINLDAWLGLINLYKSDNTKTEEQYYQLAKEMMEALKCFPYTVRDLSNMIKGKFTTEEYKFKYSILETRIYTEGKNYSDEGSAVLQPGLTRGLAAYILGQTDTRLATFSFDGADAGKIKLGSRFDGNGVRWDYSLDGKKTWKEVNSTADDHTHKLTQKELNSITSENDIYVHIVGASYSEENIYKIDILESDGLPATLYANDNENRVIGVLLSTKWRYSENDNWISYSEASPDLTGDKTVQLIQGATGVKLASKTPVTYTFTKNTDTNKRKYIPVSHISLHTVSTQATSQGRLATNAIDANYNTNWHSAWNGSDEQRFISVKFDKPIDLSAVEFVPAGGGNGKILDGSIYGSMDGEKWDLLVNKKNLTYSNSAANIPQAIENIQSFDLPEAKTVQYVKIVADRASNGNWFTARAFNFYQDLTNTHIPTASIGYSTTEKTNQSVVARLVNASTEIKITNNNGKDTYVFTENGEFTFEFEDKDGNKGTTTARVTWIDKKEPTADIEYSLSEDKKLIAILDNISEDVYLLDKDNKKTNLVEVENGKVVSVSFLDKSENIYKIAELDENKVTKKITYTNTLKDASENVKKVKYYVNSFGNEGEVQRKAYDNNGQVVELTDSELNELKKLEESRSNPLEIYLENNEEYEFKLLDMSKNIAYKSVKVDYISDNTKILVSDITYSITTLTNQDVIATIKPYVIDSNGSKTDGKVIDEEGNVTSNTHTFEQNGTFEFKYAELGEGEESSSITETHTAKVSWIDRTAPTAQIKYSTQNSTDKPVVVTLVNESEEIIITNNGTSREHTFTENGEFTFEFEDRAGNKGTAKAKVDWIKDSDDTDKDTNLTSKKYKIESGFITGIRPKLDKQEGTSVDEFKGNITTNQTLKFIDAEGKELSGKDLIKTGTKLKVGESVEYILVVRGDIDGDGEITINDLAKMKLHCIEMLTLEGSELKAAELDGDGEITINDLAVLKLTLIGLTTIN